MNQWNLRPIEERGLLAPSFCSMALWAAADSYANEINQSISFELMFLILPMAFHGEAREFYPRSVRTSLIVWLSQHPIGRSRITSRAKVMTPYTREALLFGSVHGMFSISDLLIERDVRWRSKINRAVRGMSEDSASCIKCAAFIGKWFAKSGESQTVMALLGVRP